MNSKIRCARIVFESLWWSFRILNWWLGGKVWDNDESLQRWFGVISQFRQLEWWACDGETLKVVIDGLSPLQSI